MNYKLLAGNLSVNSYYYNFNIEKKENITSEDAFKQNKTSQLITKCNTILNKIIADLYSNNKVELDESETYTQIKSSDRLFKKEHLSNFIIKEDKFIFIYNFGFPPGTFDIENNIQFSINEIINYLQEDFKNNLIFII